MSMKILAAVKCLTLVIVQQSQNIMVIQNLKDLVVETAGFSIEEFVGLKLKMYL